MERNRGGAKNGLPGTLASAMTPGQPLGGKLYAAALSNRSWHRTQRLAWGTALSRRGEIC